MTITKACETKDKQIKRASDFVVSAMPEKTVAVLSAAGYKVISTGIKHGTVTAFAHGGLVEVITYRIDGEHLDRGIATSRSSAR